MEWLFNGCPVTEIDEKYVSFVYLITNLETNRKYIGKKKKQFSKTKQTKGKKKKIKVESDWKEYYGSCKELLEDVNELGKDKFKREILMFCLSTGMASYEEARLQFEHRVLENPKLWYNKYISCRIHPNHIKKENK